MKTMVIGSHLLLLLHLLLFPYPPQAVVNAWSLTPLATRANEQRAFIPASRATLFSQISSVGDDNEDAPIITIESLSSGQIVELIELSFVQACMGMAQGDVQPLQLFIVAVKAALLQHKQTISALLHAVNSCPTQTKTLDPQEEDLRSTWIQAIDLVLEKKKGGGDGSSTVRNIYGPVLEDLVSVHSSGLGLNVDRFVASRKDFLLHSRNNDNLLLLQDEDDPVQVAIVTQTIKVMYNTLVVLDSEKEVGKTPKSEKKPKQKGEGGKGFG